MEEWVLGLSMGLIAGISPGPLLALVIASSLQRGFAAGARVALAPLASDGVIILLAFLALRRLPPTALTALTVVGGVFLVWLGIGTWRSAGRPVGETATNGHDMKRAVVANLLNPHPWIFWTAVGIPTVLRAWHRDPLRGIGFMAAFFALLVGTKVGIAWATARGRRFLDAAWYRHALRLCALALIGMGLWFVWLGVGTSPTLRSDAPIRTASHPVVAR